MSKYQDGKCIKEMAYGIEVGFEWENNVKVWQCRLGFSHSEVHGGTSIERHVVAWIKLCKDRCTVNDSQCTVTPLYKYDMSTSTHWYAHAFKHCEAF